MTKTNNIRIDRFHDLLGELEEGLPVTTFERLLPIFTQLADMYELEIRRNEESKIESNR